MSLSFVLTRWCRKRTPMITAVCSGCVSSPETPWICCRTTPLPLSTSSYRFVPVFSFDQILKPKAWHVSEHVKSPYVYTELNVTCYRCWLSWCLFKCLTLSCITDLWPLLSFKASALTKHVFICWTQSLCDITLMSLTPYFYNKAPDEKCLSQMLFLCIVCA